MISDGYPNDDEAPEPPPPGETAIWALKQYERGKRDGFWIGVPVGLSLSLFATLVIVLIASIH